jgi:hypothetical protein
VVEQQPVEDRCRQHLVAEDVAPWNYPDFVDRSSLRGLV